MGKQRKLINSMLSYLQQNLSGALNQSGTQNPALAGLQTDATDFLGQVKSGDLRGLKSGTFWNMDSLANRTKQRDLNYNAAAGGQAALGTAPASLLALDKANRDDEAEADYAGDFQDHLIGQVQNAKNTLMGVGELEQNRRAGQSGLLGNLYGVASQQKKPKTFFQSLAEAGLKALPSILTAI